ncbi:MAG: glutaminyl-peptide cyclotransferase [Flammeovirgaceae bacterium]
MKKVVYIISLLGVLIACEQKSNRYEGNQPSLPPPYQISLVLEHDPTAFTQGLVFYNNKLYESTGGEESWIAEVDITAGTYEKKVILDQAYFGEGITILNNKMYQLTWQSNVGFIYDLETFEKIQEFSFQSEGWGITHDNQHLIISDGTDKLYYLDTVSLAVVETKAILENGSKTDKLNELEYINGFIYANQWGTNYILKIDPKKQEVVDRLDFTPIVNEVQNSAPEANVLNGIAYNPLTNDVLITGKLWPKSYLVKIR